VHSSPLALLPSPHSSSPPFHLFLLFEETEVAAGGAAVCLLHVESANANPNPRLPSTRPVTSTSSPFSCSANVRPACGGKGRGSHVHALPHVRLEANELVRLLLDDLGAHGRAEVAACSHHPARSKGQSQSQRLRPINNTSAALGVATAKTRLPRRCNQPANRRHERGGTPPSQHTTSAGQAPVLRLWAHSSSTRHVSTRA